MRAWCALGFVAVLLGTAHADDEIDPDAAKDTGFLGRELSTLEIDDCRAIDPAQPQDTRLRLASEHYSRGETLYLQGDYDPAVKEFVAAYCLVPNYTMLKSIGQAFERDLEYEKAIAYLTRYLTSVPPDAKRTSVCGPEPQDDKETIRRRVKVLAGLPSRVYVGTTPSGAKITLSSDTVKSRGTSGEQMQILGGKYEMLVELPGYQSVTQQIEVRIGKPYTFFVPLLPELGTLSIQATPSDARLYVNDRYAGTGRLDEKVPGGTYEITAEASGRVRTTRTVKVIANQRQRELVELAEIPQTGRRQLIIAAAIGATYATGALLNAFKESEITSIGALVAGGAALAGSYFGLREDLSLGTSNLTITAGIAGAGAAFAAASIATTDEAKRQPFVGLGLLAGSTLGYIAGEKLDVRVGDAALVNSALIWGSTTGYLLSRSFDPPTDIGAGLALSGVGMGLVGGVMLARYFDISRTHAVLIDIGGLAGLVGGAAAKALFYPDDSSERLANFALGGMAVGLVAAGVLARNYDEPRILGKLSPSIGTAGLDGKATTTFGLEGQW